MTSMSLVLGIITLSLATYAFRLGGVLLGAKVSITTKTTDMLNLGSIVLLMSVAATAALYQGDVIDSWARPIGVLAATSCAIYRFPLIGTVLVAAGVTAGLRLLGLS